MLCSSRVFCSRTNRLFMNRSSFNLKTQQRNQSLEIIPTTQDFYDERTLGAKFVDKTKMIERIMRLEFGLKIFFARPRKMGKSLTVEQMKLIALGKREAFGPLENNEQQFEIYNSEDLFSKLKNMPVLHLDFSAVDVNDPVLGITRELRFSAIAFVIGLSYSSIKMIICPDGECLAK